jgi:hypothetical protein
MLHTAFKSVIAILILLQNVQQQSFEGFMSGIRANAVKGEVRFQRKDGKFDLEAGLKFEQGDVIQSRADALAEILLQPGNYLRLGGKTECQILSDNHEKMRLRLNEGAISLEILARDNIASFSNSVEQAHELIRVITPNAEVFVSEPGIFRINVADGRTEVISRNGETLINGRRVKEKRRAVASNGSVVITEIDSRVEDSLDAWARERAVKLVQANKSLKNEPPWSNREKGETSVDLPPEEKEQSDRGRVISAKPGAVNFVEDGVEFKRKSTDWTQLSEKSQLEDGDTVRTAANTFVELMLLPDVYLRLDASSEILLEQLSNDSISVKLLHGSAILDVARFDRKQDPQIKVAGPSGLVAIASHGNYRIDDDAITVRDGKVILNERSVGSCHRIAQGNVADCDKQRYDNFDFWSEHQGEGELYNGRGTVTMATHLSRLRHLRFRDTGFWFLQPGQTSYTFVPFTSQLFRSPYGGNYSTVLAPRPLLNRGVLSDKPRPPGPGNVLP